MERINSNKIIQCKSYLHNSKYRSQEDEYIGLLETDSDDLIIYYDNKDHNNCEVWGSWNKWKSGYILLKSEESDELSKYWWYIKFPNIDDFDNNLEEYVDQQMPKYGKYHYKLKKNGEWIEPTENDLREKDSDGNWNLVIFIH